MFARKGCKQGRRGAFILGEYMADPGFSRARAFVFQIQIRRIQKRITFNWRKKKIMLGSSCCTSYIRKELLIGVD